MLLLKDKLMVGCGGFCLFLLRLNQFLLYQELNFFTHVLITLLLSVESLTSENQMDVDFPDRLCHYVVE